jgi:hypothetical protein
MDSIGIHDARISETILLNVFEAADAIELVPDSIALVLGLVTGSLVAVLVPSRCLRMARTSERIRIIISKLKKLKPIKTAIITIDQKCILQEETDIKKQG